MENNTFLADPFRRSWTNSINLGDTPLIKHLNRNTLPNIVIIIHVLQTYLLNFCGNSNRKQVVLIFTLENIVNNLTKMTCSDKPEKHIDQTLLVALQVYSTCLLVLRTLV